MTTYTSEQHILIRQLAQAEMTEVTRRAGSYIHINRAAMARNEDLDRSDPFEAMRTTKEELRAYVDDLFARYSTLAELSLATRDDPEMYRLRPGELRGDFDRAAEHAAYDAAKYDEEKSVTLDAAQMQALRVGEYNAAMDLP